MQSLFLRVAIVQFYKWYCDEITKSSAVVRCWPEADVGSAVEADLDKVSRLGDHP
jgi:hypothetical protein